MNWSKTFHLQMAFRAIYIALPVALVALCNTAQAQSLQATLVLSPNPPRSLSDWRTSRDAVKLIVMNPKVAANIRIGAKLSYNGTVVAATKREIPLVPVPAGQSILYGGELIPSEYIDFFGELKQPAARTGILPEGNYEFCVQLFSGLEQVPVSNAACRSFAITQYLLPQLVLPENEKEFVTGMEKLVTFRWTPVMPQPAIPVIYRLRVVEVLAGQTPQQAFATSQPFFEKKITNMTQEQWPVEIAVPPQGVTLAWGVQPEDSRGMAIVSPEGFTPPFALKFLPISPECMALSDKVKQNLKTLLAMEERYWQEYDLVERAERLQEQAEDRGDVYETEHWQTKLVVSAKSLESVKERYEAAFGAYESALQAYKDCIEK